MSTESTLERTVRVLNEALEADPYAINKLFHTRIKANQNLVNHPDIITGEFNDDIGQSYIRPLGILNAALGLGRDGIGQVGMVLDNPELDTGTIVKFVNIK